MTDHCEPALFPLPLTAFEQYMLRDDRPAYPMTFEMRARLSGAADRAALEAALEEALSRHPMLCAVIDRNGVHGPQWCDGGTRRPPLDWGPAGKPLAYEDGPAIDLTRQVGLRVWVRVAATTTQMALQFHHACVDGIGAMQFFGDLLAAYGIRMAAGQAAPVLLPLDRGRLRRRGSFAAPAADVPIRRLQALRATMHEAVKWLSRRPALLEAPPTAPDAGATDSAFPVILSHALEEEETRRLRRAAVRMQATLNDLCLRDMFLTLKQWNEAHHPKRPGQWLRINVPTNLRGHGDAAMPAANMLSFAFVTRHLRQCENEQALLEGVRWETAMIRRWSLGLYFLGALEFGRRVPGLMRLFLGGQHCFATAIVTNLGEITRRMGARFPRHDGKLVAGNLVLEEWLGVPPLRPKTRAGFAIGVFNDRLTVALRCDPHCFSLEDSRQLLMLYVATLKDGLSQAEDAGQLQISPLPQAGEGRPLSFPLTYSLKTIPHGKL